MHIDSIGDLLMSLRASEAPFSGTSCLLTGSLARGELRAVANNVQSDIDLLLVVSDKETALEKRGPLQVLLRNTAKEFAVEIGCAITLKRQLRLRYDAGFVQSASKARPIWDHMQIDNLLNELSKHPVERTHGALGQPVSYYCATARVTKRMSDLTKACRSIEILRKCLAPQSLTASMEIGVRNSIDTVTQAAVNALASSGSIWPSSVYFLKSLGVVDDSDLLLGVRDRDSRERHGLEFSLAYVRG